MKKISLFLCLVLILTVLTSCSGKDINTENTTDVNSTSVSESQNVVIHIKKDLVEETEFLSYVSEFEGLKVTSDDVFHILTMSQQTYTELLKSKAQTVYDTYDSMITEGGYIQKFEYGKDFRTVKVIVDRESFDSVSKDTQRLELITIGAHAMSYQMFLTEGQKTTVTAVYSDTNEEAMVISLPITV